MSSPWLMRVLFGLKSHCQWKSPWLMRVLFALRVRTIGRGYMFSHLNQYSMIRGSGSKWWSLWCGETICRKKDRVSLSLLYVHPDVPHQQHQGPQCTCHVRVKGCKYHFSWPWDFIQDHITIYSPGFEWPTSWQWFFLVIFSVLKGSELLKCTVNWRAVKNE